MVTPWGLPIVPIVWVSIVLDDPPTPARTGLLLSMDVYPHISTCMDSSRCSKVDWCQFSYSCVQVLPHGHIRCALLANYPK